METVTGSSISEDLHDQQIAAIPRSVTMEPATLFICNSISDGVATAPVVVAVVVAIGGLSAFAIRLSASVSRYTVYVGW